jgi:hypothetical protein
VNNALSVTDSVSITPTTALGINLQPFDVNSGDTSELRFAEIAANGSEYTGFKAPDSLAASFVYTLPDAPAAASDYVLTYQAGGVLEWKNASSVGTVGDITSVGDVVTGAAFGGTDAGNTLYFQGATLDTNTIALTGGITSAGSLALNGGNITTTAGAATLFNTNATTLSVGGDATTIAIGAATGITTINNSLVVGNDLTVNGQSTFQPTGTNGVTIVTDADSILTVSGLPTASGSLVCVTSGTSQITKCASDAISLQSAYTGGGTIATTDNKDIAFTLSDTATDANFTVTTADGSTGYSAFTRANGTGTADPNQLILLNNLDTNRAVPAGIKILSAAGGITTALDVSDAAIGNAISIGANDIAGTNFSVNGGTGSITSAGNIAVNSGSITTTTTTGNVFNTNATTLNVGGAATTVSIGAATGTATISNANISFPNATAINATGALLTVDSGSFGGAYGSTGVSISSTGNIQANGTLTIDGASTLTGNVTTAGNIAVNGGTLSTTAGTAYLFNANATTLNIGGDATAVSLGAGTGTTTVNNDLTITGVTTANNDFTAYGQSTFTPSGTNDINLTTDADSFLNIAGLTTASGSVICVDGSNNVVKCASASLSLQAAYNSGNTITTTNNRDLSFTLADTATDANFSITTATGSTGGTQFIRADGVGTNDPTQLVLIDNADADRILPIGLKVSSSGGSGVTTALDVSDASIVTAIALGANDITGTNFSVAGSTGSITSGGNIAVNGGSITTTQSTGNLFNTNATTLNIGGAATSLTIGATTGTATIRNATISLPNATAINAAGALATIDSASIGGGYGSTGVAISNAGNIQANGALTIDGISTLTGNVSTAGDVAVNGGDITTTALTATLFNANATTLSIGGDATTVSLGGITGTTTINNDLAVLGTGTFTGVLTANNDFLANTQSTFSPSGTNGVVINTDGDSYLTLNGLTTPGVAGSSLCVDGSNNVTKCGGATFSLQAAYNGGNTITTTDARDIAFTLANTATDANFSVTSATGSTGGIIFTRADGVGAADPSQLVLIQNLDTDRSLPTGLKIAGVSGGNVTTALDLSDTNITTAIDLGANNIAATHFTLTGTSGDITTDGDIAVNGGDITTTAGTATVFNTGAATLGIGGASTALTLGATTGTTTIRNLTLALPNATAINAAGALISVSSAAIGGGYGSTGVSISSTGNIQANGTLTVDGASTLTGAVTTSGTINANGGTIATNQTTGNLFNTTATTLNIGGAASAIAIGAGTGTTTINNALTATGLITANGGETVASGQTFAANGQSTFSPDSTNSC